MTDKADSLFIDENPTDVVHAVLSLVQTALLNGRELNDSALLEIEGTIRKNYGNVSTYCAGKTPAKTLSKLVRADLARGVSRRSIAQTYSISESTVRRYAEYA